MKIKYKIILFGFLILACFSSTAQIKKDSLWTVYNTKTLHDSIRLKALSEIAKSYVYNKPDTAIVLGEQQILLAQKSNVKSYEAMAFNIIGTSLKNKGDQTEALVAYRKALIIRTELGDKKGIANCCNNIGIIYLDRSDYPKAMECFLNGLKINEDIENKKGTADSYNNIGLVYQNQSNYPKALESYKKSLKLNEELGSKRELGGCYNNIGIVYHKQFNYADALNYHLKSLKIREELGDLYSMGTSYFNIAAAYSAQSNYETALEYNLKALEIRKKVGDKQGIATSYGNLSNLYLILKNYKLAIQYAGNALEIGKAIGNLEIQRNAYHHLSFSYGKINKYKEAYDNHLRYKNVTDTIFNAENSKQLGDMKTQLEVDKKEAELKLKAEAQQALTDEEQKRQQLVIYAVAGVLLVVIIFSGLLYKRFRLTNKQKQIIELKNKETEIQKHIIEGKQKEILDSINYAKRIQSAILANEEDIKAYFPKSFLLYHPKDIVAGDFYFFESTKTHVFYAAADCTGHGVPGALVSVVCSNALSRCVKEFELTEPGEILDKARELVLDTFKKSGQDVKDGMDISLLVKNLNNNSYKWAGANNPLWYIQNDKMTVITANKQSIGLNEKPQPFTSHALPLQENDTVFLFTDGFADQFGGPKGKKFKYKHLSNSLVEMSALTISEQKEKLETVFYSWKGDLEQVDDVLLVGIRL